MSSLREFSKQSASRVRPQAKPQAKPVSVSKPVPRKTQQRQAPQKKVNFYEVSNKDSLLDNPAAYDLELAIEESKRHQDLSFLETVDPDLIAEQEYTLRSAIDCTRVSMKLLYPFLLKENITLNRNNGFISKNSREAKFLQDRISFDGNNTDTLYLDSDIRTETIECGSMAIDDNGDVVDYNTCLYNSIYTFLAAVGLTGCSLPEFISIVHNTMGQERIVGEFAGTDVIQAICDMYGIAVVCIHNTSDKKDTKAPAMSVNCHSSFNELPHDRICYLSNTSGVTHYKLLLPSIPALI
jgi:hypothetical protein